MLSIARAAPLAEFTTFGVGGPADYYAEVFDEDGLLEAAGFARAKKIPLLALGAGSNVLISDTGFRGLVARIKISGFAREIREKSIRIFAGAGELWDDIVARTVASGWHGCECLSGIPGTVGAVIAQNIDAYGASIAPLILTVRAYDLQEEKFFEFDRDTCEFGYHESIFKKFTDRYIISRATFELQKGKKTELSTYHNVQKYFTDWRGEVTLQDIRASILDIRRKKGMLITQEGEWLKSAGSFFKNPVVDQKKFHDLVEKIGERDQAEGPWFWRLTDDSVKIAAACLIEHAGFRKGCREGNVGLSPYHTLAIVNYGDTTAGRIVSFAKHIQEKVFQQYGVFLEPEVQWIGFDAYPLLKK